MAGLEHVYDQEQNEISRSPDTISDSEISEPTPPLLFLTGMLCIVIGLFNVTIVIGDVTSERVGSGGVSLQRQRDEGASTTMARSGSL